MPFPAAIPNIPTTNQADQPAARGERHQRVEPHDGGLRHPGQPGVADPVTDRAGDQRTHHRTAGTDAEQHTDDGLGQPDRVVQEDHEQRVVAAVHETADETRAQHGAGERPPERVPEAVDEVGQYPPALRCRRLRTADHPQRGGRDQETRHVDGDGAGRAQRLQQYAGEAGSADVRRPLGGEQLAVGVGEPRLVADDHRNVRRVRHLEQHTERAGEERHQHQMRNREDIRERRHRHGGEQPGPTQIGEDQQRTPHPPVDEHPQRNADQQPRHVPGGGDQADLERPRVEIGDRDQRQRDDRDRGTDRTDPLPEEEQTEVALPEQARHAREAIASYWSFLPASSYIRAQRREISGRSIRTGHG
jgi:hypothetical protein